MTKCEMEQRAINEVVSIKAYDPAWPAQFIAERERLQALVPEIIAIEHIGSTAVHCMAAKPIVDMMAAVASMEVADGIVERLCANGYITSAEYNRKLQDRRWLMRHADGRRTHHLHLLLTGSDYWIECLRFRDLLRKDSKLVEQYIALKQELAGAFGTDREGYGDAKTTFIKTAIKAGL